MKHLLHALAAMALLASTWAMADDDDVRATPRTPLLAEYQQECASCHLAYPPALLPAASWGRLMDNLPTHFGTDASLAPDQVKRLSQWLQQTANAANARRRSEPPPQDRITRSRWFLHEHDELPASVWQRPSIQRPSNCMACHTRADQGDFRERYIRVPR